MAWEVYTASPRAHLLDGDTISLASRKLTFGTYNPGASRLRVEFDSDTKMIRFTADETNGLRVYIEKKRYFMTVTRIVKEGKLPAGGYRKVAKAEVPLTYQYDPKHPLSIQHEEKA